jgi:hypothetical protein
MMKICSFSIASSQAQSRNRHATIRRSGQLRGEPNSSAGAPTGEWSGYADQITAFGRRRLEVSCADHRHEGYREASRAIAAYAAECREFGAIRGSQIVIDGQQVVGAQATSIPDPAGGVTVDLEARSTVSEMFSALRQHGLIFL